MELTVVDLPGVGLAASGVGLAASVVELVALDASGVELVALVASGVGLVAFVVGLVVYGVVAVVSAVASWAVEMGSGGMLVEDKGSLSH